MKRISRRKRLEELFNKYPDVPKEVIVKEDVLHDGLAFTTPALEIGKGYRCKMYGGWLFTFDMATEDTKREQKLFSVPDYIEIHGGLYNLRGRTRMRCRINPDSQYIIDVADGKPVLCERGVKEHIPIADLHEYRPIPKYFSKYFEDGTAYKDVCRADGFLVVFMMCQYWGPKQECKFCDMNENTRTARARGDLSIKKPFKKVEHVATVVEEIFLKEKWAPYDRPVGVIISGGSITTKLDGLRETDFYIRYVEAVRDKIGNRYPITLQSSPKPREEAKRLRAAGVDVHNPNIEVWDKRLFEIICPGKAKAVGWDSWHRLAADEVDIFGEGNVAPGVVVGVEMAKPWGFTDIREAVKSTTEGFEFFMSRGAVPRPIDWIVEPGSMLAGQEAPPTEYFIEIDRNWFELLTKYHLPPYGGFSGRIIGPGLGEYANNAALDMGYG